MGIIGILFRILMIFEMPFVFVCLFLLINSKEEDFFNSLCYSIIAFFTIVLMITEGLSFFNILSVQLICIIWSMLSICMALMVRRQIFAKRYFTRMFKKGKEVIWLNNSALQKLFVVLIGGILLATLFMSVCTVVNNGDSMGYHLVRLMHWLQQKNVNAFFTNDQRQNIYPILSEYTLLQIYALWGSDSLLNILQWSSYLVSALYIFKISRKLSISKNFSLIAALLYLTMPLTIAESMTTQVDLLGSLWVILFTYLLFDFIKPQKLVIYKHTIIQIVGITMCVAFAYLTKSNACFMMAIMFGWLLIVRIKRRDSLLVLLQCGVVAAITLFATIMPNIYRTLTYTSDRSASSSYNSLLIGSFHPRYVILNAYKSISMELMQHIFIEVDDILKKSAGALAAAFQISINDPLIGFGNTDYYETATSMYYYFHCDHAGNALVMVLVIIAMILLPILKINESRKKKNENAIKTKDANISIYAFSVTLYIGFFVTAGLVRWQPWVTRLLLPALVLLIIPVAYVLQKTAEKFKLEQIVLGFILCALIMGSANSFMYNIRPSLKNVITTSTKQELYFYYFPEQAQLYKEVTDYIIEENFKTVGLTSSNFEYPIWAALSEKEIHIEHVDLKKDMSYVPDCIVIQGDAYIQGEKIMYGRTIYSYAKIAEGNNTRLGVFIKNN